MNRLIASALIALLAPAAAFAADEVRLIYATSAGCPPTSGCFRDQRFAGRIEVANLAYHKQVRVVYSAPGGVWRHIDAHHVRTSPDGSRDVFEFDARPVRVQRFAVAYTVGGQTYWDNNGGVDYWLRAYEYDAVLGHGVDIGGAQVVAYDAPGDGVLDVHLLVRNRAADKVIRAHYTEDGWRTVREARGAYLATLGSNLEVWGLAIPLADDRPAASDAVFMAFELRWPGGAAWDNNLGLDHLLVGGELSAR